jgi:hypothetical protein
MISPGASMKGRMSSAVTWAIAHHGAVKCASRNTPPVKRTDPRTCDRASIKRRSRLIWPNGQENRPDDHLRKL